MSFTKTSIFLTNGQKKKLATALKKMSPIKFKLSASQLKKQGGLPMMVTKTQLNNMNKSKRSNKGMMLNVSLSQIRAMKKEGGILPFLVPIAVAGASALATGALSALGGLAVNKIADALEGEGLGPLGSGLGPIGSGLGPLGSGLRPLGGNVTMQGLPPVSIPNSLGMMPIGGNIQPSLQIGGKCSCGQLLGQGLFPIGETFNNKRRSGSGLFPHGVYSNRN